MRMMLRDSVLPSIKTQNKASDATLKATKRSRLRAKCAQLLLDVQRGQSLSRALPATAEQLPDNERPRLGEIIYGSCRFYFQLQAILAKLMQKPMRQRDRVIETLLLTSLYQLQHMRIAEHAVVTEAVEATRQLKKPMFSKLVNGVLRGFLRNRERLLKEIDQDPQAKFGLPDWMIKRLSADWPQHWQQIAGGFLQTPAFTIRVNQRCNSLADYQNKLQQAGISAATIKGVSSALQLDQAIMVDKLPGFEQGHASVQDAGAQLAAILLDPQPGEQLLDACAAPGGKTGHLLESAQNLQLTAIDIDKARVQRVQENLARLGLSANVQQGDAASLAGDWIAHDYDAILLDVPCSASGVIRRHPDIRLLRRESDLDALVKTQQQILQNCWQLLKPGGRLLYATCSLFSVENEKQIAAFMQRNPDADEVELQLDCDHQVRSHGIQLTPEKNNMDGFYYALLQKHHG